MSASKQAVQHLANRLCQDGRLAFLIGPGSQCYEMIVNGFAEITGETATAVRNRLEKRMRPIRLMDRQLANALDQLLEGMADSEAVAPLPRYAPEALAAASNAEAVLREYREAVGC